MFDAFDVVVNLNREIMEEKMENRKENTCKICGKPLSNPESIERGMGEVCAGRLNKFRHHTKSHNDSFDTDYSYDIIDIAGVRVALIIDNDKGRSVTNAIEKICQDIRVEHAIYRDTLGTWDYWSPATGFQTLALNGIPTKDMNDAVKIAEARIFNKVGGLFSTVA